MSDTTLPIKYRFSPYLLIVHYVRTDNILTHWSLEDVTNFRLIIFKLISMINILSILCEIVLRWMTQNLTDDESS